MARPGDRVGLQSENRPVEALRDIDQLAYIRFASVYHSYEDISTLKREVDRLMKQRTPADR